LKNEDISNTVSSVSPPQNNENLSVSLKCVNDIFFPFSKLESEETSLTVQSNKKIKNNTKNFNFFRSLLSLFNSSENLEKIKDHLQNVNLSHYFIYLLFYLSVIIRQY
jgi:hypothetical protein